MGHKKHSLRKNWVQKSHKNSYFLQKFVIKIQFGVLKSWLLIFFSLSRISWCFAGRSVLPNVRTLFVSWTYWTSCRKNVWHAAPHILYTCRALPSPFSKQNNCLFLCVNVGERMRFFIDFCVCLSVSIVVVVVDCMYLFDWCERKWCCKFVHSFWCSTSVYFLFVLVRLLVMCELNVVFFTFSLYVFVDEQNKNKRWLLL